MNVHEAGDAPRGTLSAQIFIDSAGMRVLGEIDRLSKAQRDRAPIGHIPTSLLQSTSSAATSCPSQQPDLAVPQGCSSCQTRLPRPSMPPRHTHTNRHAARQVPWPCASCSIWPCPLSRWSPRVSRCFSAAAAQRLVASAGFAYQSCQYFSPALPPGSRRIRQHQVSRRSSQCAGHSACSKVRIGSIKRSLTT